MGIFNVQLVRIFVSSPGDVQAERDILETAIDEVNRSDGERCGVVLRSFRWERDVVPRIGPPPQTVVDGQTPPCDIYIGLMASRFGTPTGGFGSGTEKEFQDAFRQWAKCGQPWILFYFHNSPPLPRTSKEIAQYAKNSFPPKQAVRAKGSGVVFGQRSTTWKTLYPKTTPDPFRRFPRNT